ncbi:MAG: hypothetical protein F9K25_14135 [Candidatus Contendobacter sp.]|nr:MAG: hypothetical protein F9K25_14135 [Candidatus Contendobacter sp.]
MSKFTVALMVAALGATLAGCGSAMQQTANQQEELLMAAGFAKKPADTPEKMSRLRRVPLYEVAVRKKGDQPVYYYADPNVCRCIYLGNEINYQNYRRLLIERNMRTSPVAVTPADMEAEEEWGVLGSR